MPLQPIRRGYTHPKPNSVAVFDTGLSRGHSHFRGREPVERINWTSEQTTGDTFGHAAVVFHPRETALRHLHTAVTRSRTWLLVLPQQNRLLLCGPGAADGERAE